MAKHDYKIHIHHPRSGSRWSSMVMSLDSEQVSSMRKHIFDSLQKNPTFYILNNEYGEYIFPKEFLRECVILIESI